MDLKKLAENISDISEEALIESAKSKGDKYGDAMRFFKSKTLPDGGKWGGEMSPKLGFDNAPRISKARKKDVKGGLVYSARIRFAPGKGGGAGIGINPAASNHLFNILGTDNKSVTGVSKAFASFVEKNRSGVNEALRRWLKKHDNFLYNVVGWKNQDMYSIEDVSFKAIKYEDPMVDITRRKWPAGRTEIWVPVTADVVITLRKKEKRG